MTQSPRRTILVLAYSISPARGSEYAVAWNYVMHMARDHDLIVLFGAAGEHMGDMDEIQSLPSNALGDQVTFVAVPPDRRARIANHFNRTGALPYSFYVAYRYWHRSALAVARRIVVQRHVDIVHYVGPIGFREPGYLWKLGLPYIWGPIGGAEPRPVLAFAGFGPKHAVLTAVRNMVNGIQLRFNPRVRAAMRATDVLLAATSGNAHAIERIYRRTPIVVPENAVTTVPAAAKPPSCSNQPLRLIWVGTMEVRKALPILLRALARLDRHGRWQLDVVGSGPMQDAWRAQADALSLGADIRWHGKVPRKRAMALFLDADVHVLTSLAEANTTVLWEAMASGVPTVAIDHCGMHDSICDACGVRVPLADFDTMAKAFAATLNRLIDDRTAVKHLSDGALACATRQNWSNRITFWNRIYEEAVAVHAGREPRA
jgi:glycosyltransferase involved in cell wall biosynthesis